MASAATHLAVDTEAFTVKVSQVLLVALGLALSYLLVFLALEADPAGLAEQDRVQVGQAPAPAATPHPDRRKLKSIKLLCTHI